MVSGNMNGNDGEDKPLVLVVDDDPNVVALARGYLERDGYRVPRPATESGVWSWPEGTGPAWWCWTSCFRAWTGSRSAGGCRWSR